jgi:membrane associated rhomboid family serine protease
MEPAPGLELREERPSFWSVAFSLLVGVLMCLAVALAMYIRAGGVIGRFQLGPNVFPVVELIEGQIAVALAAAAGSSVVVRWARRRRPPRVIRLEPAGVLLPRGALLRDRIVSYSEIVSLPIQRVRLLHRTFLSVGLRRGGPTILSDRRFGPPERLHVFRAAILLAIDALPAGGDQRARVERRSRSDERSAGVPWLSLALALVMGGLYWATFGNDPFITAHSWVFTKGLVAKGELFRVVTANWFHGNHAHLASNTGAILLFGYLGERVLGWQPMLGIGMASGILGFLAISLAPMNSFDSAGGMSAWALGWLGSWLWVRARHGAAFPPLLQSWAITISAYLLLFKQWTGLAPVDIAHGIGFVTGIAATALITRDWSRSSRQPVSVSAGRSMVWASAAVLSGALAWGFVDAARGGEGDARLVLQWMLEEADPASMEINGLTARLNDAAWHAARTPSASREWLELSDRSARWAVDLARWAAENGRETWEAGYLDTLATVRYRLGDFDSAVDLAWQAIELEDEPDRAAFHRSQAARFELAAWRVAGSPRVDGARDARFEAALDRRALRLTFDEPSAEGLTLHAVALRAGRPIAHIRAKTPASLEAAAPIELALTDEGRAALAGCDEIVTTRIEAIDTSPAAPQVEIHAVLEEVLELP